MNAGHAYLETQIATATPQRLRLMLIEGAIRQARVAEEALASFVAEDAFEPLLRCRSLVAELIAGIRPGSSPLADSVLSIYLFLFRELSDPQMRKDISRVRGILRVLAEERLTWQQVCDTLPDRPEETAAHLPHEILAPAFLQPAASAEEAESVSFEA